MRLCYGALANLDHQTPPAHLIVTYAYETYVRTVKMNGGVLTLRTLELDKSPDGDTFNELTWTRL